MLRRVAQNESWPPSGLGGQITRASLVVCNASWQGAKSDLVGRFAAYPLPLDGSLPLKRGGQIHKWPTSVKCRVD